MSEKILIEGGIPEDVEHDSVELADEVYEKLREAGIDFDKPSWEDVVPDIDFSIEIDEHNVKRVKRILNTIKKKYPHFYYVVDE